MDLREQIIEDLKQAMKSGNKLRLETLRSLKAALMEKEIEVRGNGKILTEGEMVTVLMSMAKKRRESIDLFLKGNRPELAEQEQQELLVIQEYLPKMMTEDEILKVIQRVIDSAGATSSADFNKVMPSVMKEVKGKADGRLVQELVRSSLGGLSSGGRQ